MLLMKYYDFPIMGQDVGFVKSVSARNPDVQALDGGSCSLRARSEISDGKESMSRRNGGMAALPKPSDSAMFSPRRKADVE
jgi:hypothetical protein